MTIEEFAQSILFGTSLEEKLTTEPGELNPSPKFSPIEVPSFPGRPSHLARIGKAPFPSVHQLQEATERGKVLHFFANHELLAMELMALVLLRFPEAPLPFRRGIVRIIHEEQSHLRLYISRMKELGIEFGELPVNDYFWNTMKGMKSPLDFTVQMSLTFEQANLDFSLFFKNAVERAGDSVTAAILDQVYREEMGHVKHGVTWFNRWRENETSESDWDAYVKLLPLPMTPQRAKGLEFSEEARRQVGLSETFIRELRLYSGSKGRPPVLWIYNPHCDQEIVRGKPGFTPTEGMRKITRDLEHFPMFLCLDKDVVLVNEKPQAQWLETLQKSGFDIPEFVELKNQSPAQSVRAPKIGGIEPWGWSPDTFLGFQALQSKLVETAGGNSSFCKKLFSYKNYESSGIGKLFSKSWSTDFLRARLPSDEVGASYSDWKTAKQRIQQILDEGQFAMVKAPYGTSGMQVRRIQKTKELEGPIGGWIKNVLTLQGSIVIEHWLDKLFDLSIQMDIHRDRIELLEVRQFITGKQNEYRGTYLGRKLQNFTAEQLKFFHRVLPEWHQLLRDLGHQLRKEGYLGPAGVDAMIWKTQNGELRLKPLVELNPRWTMGRVALELEKHLLPGVNGLWIFIPLRELKNRGFETAESFTHSLHQKYPIQMTSAGGGQRIASGVLFTNDASKAQSVLSVLATLPNPDLLPTESIS